SGLLRFGSICAGTTSPLASEPHGELGSKPGLRAVLLPMRPSTRYSCKGGAETFQLGQQGAMLAPHWIVVVLPMGRIKRSLRRMHQGVSGVCLTMFPSRSLTLVLLKNSTTLS